MTRCVILRPVLPDYLTSGLDVILVGINPGLRSAEKGHHFAGPGHKFWDLLKDSGLTPKKLHYREDGDLLGYGIGLTNIVPRPSSSSSDLGPEDYQAGRRTLRTKIERYRPKIAACVGITVLRELWPEISTNPKPNKVECGHRPETIGKTALFVLPNPSGRNAHYSYTQMLNCWKKLTSHLNQLRSV